MTFPVLYVFCMSYCMSSFSFPHTHEQNTLYAMWFKDALQKRYILVLKTAVNCAIFHTGVNEEV